MGQEDEGGPSGGLRRVHGHGGDDGRSRPDARFFHCLPAHRGDEVAAEVIDGPRSRVILQGHNRLHASRGRWPSSLATAHERLGGRAGCRPAPRRRSGST